MGGNQVSHGLTWDEAEARAAAQDRLDRVLVRLKDLGATASGEIGSPDPVAAARDALRGHPADEILLSTLPVGISHWLGLDVPASLRQAVTVPVTVVTAPRVPAGAATG